ncbi:MAG: carbohydrate ABC transporter permease [Clostridiales bacterium]|nr:carbohydrate ABC transporter permease [Clostridiales bacterium]
MVGSKNKTGLVLKAIFIIVFSFIFILPLWLVFTASLESSEMFARNGYGLWIYNFSVKSYEVLFAKPQFWVSFGNSFWITISTVVLSVVVNTLTAYVLAEKDLPFSKFLNFLFVFTMFFNAGMIPTYLTIKSLGMYNTVWALIIPPALGVYNILLIRNFLYSLPKAMTEAAVIDGANYFQVLIKVIVPVSMPIIVTTALITLIAKWNSWMDILLYISKTDKNSAGIFQFWTVQYYIRTLLNEVEASGTGADGSFINGKQVLSASIVVTILPVVLLFPLLQKYFANGITLGAVKG